MMYSSSAPDLGSLLSGGHTAPAGKSERTRLPFLPPEEARSFPRSSSVGSFSPNNARLNRTAPGAMLNGLTAFAEEENTRVEQNLSHIGESKKRENKRKSTSKLSSKMPWRRVQNTVMLFRMLGGKAGDWPPHLIMDEEDMTREMDSVTASISQLRRRHETFQPLSPDQAARQKLFGSPQDSDPQSPGRAASGRVPAKCLDPEERRERFELLKFVRKIEPELPPLERMPPSKEAPPNQALVNFNASSEAIQRWRPDVRSKLLEESAAEHTEHVREVVKNAMAVKAAARARKRELGEQRANGSRVKLLGDAPNAAGQWFVLCAAGSFMHNIAQDLRLHKVQDKDEYVKDNWESLRRMKLPRNTLTGGMVDLFGRLRDAEFMKRAPLLGAIFVSKIGIRRKRLNARAICTCLRAWRAAGPIFLQLKRVGARVRKLQRWWRQCMENLHTIHQAVSQKWVDAEREIILTDFKSTIAWKMSEDRDLLEVRIDAARIPKEVRATFIEHDLRARRYLLLPRLYLWEEETRRWQEEMQEWRAEREARMVISNGEPVELPAFSWAPIRPTFAPSNMDIQQMLRRCMANPKGWLTANPSKPTKMNKRRQTAASGPNGRKSRGTTVQFAEPLELGGSAAPDDDEEAYLWRLGISESHMPGGLARPPPPTTECEGDEEDEEEDD